MSIVAKFEKIRYSEVPRQCLRERIMDRWRAPFEEYSTNWFWSGAFELGHCKTQANLAKEHGSSLKVLLTAFNVGSDSRHRW